MSTHKQVDYFNQARSLNQLHPYYHHCRHHYPLIGHKKYFTKKYFTNLTAAIYKYIDVEMSIYRDIWQAFVQHCSWTVKMI